MPNKRKTSKVCRSCGEEKLIEEFTHKAHKCDMCKASSENGEHHLARMDRKIKELADQNRYKNAYVQKGYKFTGTIPEPKEVGYYKFNNSLI